MFEGNEFIFERFTPGAVINSNYLYSQGDEGFTYTLRSIEKTILLELSIELFEDINMKDKVLQKNFMLQQNRIMSRPKKIPLDFVFAYKP